MRRTTFVGLAAFAGAVAAFGFGSDIVMLDVLRAVQGLACGCIWGGALTWVIAVTEPSRRGRVLGSAMSAAIMGTLLGPALGTAAVALGTGVVFSALGVIALGLAGWVLCYPDPARSSGGPGPPVGELLRNHALALGTWIILLEAMTIGAVYTLIPLRLARFGASSVVIGATFLVASALRTVVAPAVGRASDRWGAIGPASVGLVLAILLMAALPLPTSALALAIVSVIAMGGPLTAFFIPGASVLTVAAEGAGMTLAMATMLFNLAFAAGQTIGSPAAASLAQATSDAVPFAVLCALLTATLLVVVLGRRQPQIAQAAAPREQAAAPGPQAGEPPHTTSGNGPVPVRSSRGRELQRVNTR